MQRAILGVTIQDVSSELVAEKKLDGIEGVYVNGIRPEGAAKQSGLKEGHVIISIDEVLLNSSAELQEQVSKFRPGEEEKVIIRREGKLKQFDVVLRNLEGSTEIVLKEDVMHVLGASFEALSDKEMRALGIENGVKVTTVKEGKFMKVGIEEGFVVTSVNKRPVTSVKDIVETFEEIEGGVIIEGVDRNGSKSYYAFGM